MKNASFAPSVTPIFSLVKPTQLEANLIREVRVSYRTTRRKRIAITQPEQVATFVRSVLHDNAREHVVALYLDAAHQVSAYALISIGLANFAHVHPREIYQRAIAVGSVALVIAHNHPSGQLEPSSEDRTLTTQLKDAGQIIGIRLLDHIIVTDDSHTSFRERGLLV